MQTRRHGLRAGAVGVFWIALAVMTLAPRPPEPQPTIGETSLADVIAPVRIEVIDREAMGRDEARVRETYQRVWTFLPGAIGEAQKSLREVSGALAAGDPTTGVDVQVIRDNIYRDAGVLLSNEDIDYLYKSANLPRFIDYLVDIVRQTLGGQFIVGDVGLFNAHRRLNVLALNNLPIDFAGRSAIPEPIAWPQATRRYVAEELRRFYPEPRDARVREIGAKILMDCISPNLGFDGEETSRRRAHALRTLAPRLHTYDAGERIIGKGEVASAAQAAALDRVAGIERQAYPLKMAGVIVLTLLAFISTAMYLGRMRSDIGFNPSDLTIVFLPILIALGMGRFVDFLATYFELSPLYVAVLFPVSLVGMLATMLLGSAAGYILVLVSALNFAVATGQGMEFMVITLFGGFAAIVSLRSIRERRDVLEAGFRVGLVNMAAVFLLALFRLPVEFDPILLLVAFLYPLMLSGVTFLLLRMFEGAFGVVTDIGLLELCSPSNELLRMLEDRSPGTYQHTLNVMKLAESAAEAIGANYLLVRAGAYFHDIGKMLKPKYFSENQVSVEDKKVHSKVSPYMSVLIIKNHVKEGIELAKKHGLPKKVIDFIPQHHGTSLIRYFYSEALERYESSETTDVVHEDDFRYPGPKPQTIETAIVLLADSIEAITTSMFTSSRVNENDLRRVVGEAISDRFEDGQFDECDLTMRDLSMLRESFVRTLKARFHHRIAYPENPKRDAPRTEREGGATPTPIVTAAQG